MGGGQVSSGSGLEPSWGRGMQDLPGVPGMVEHRPGGEVASGFCSNECQCTSRLLRPWVLDSSDLLMDTVAGAPQGHEPTLIPASGCLLAHKGVGTVACPGSERAGGPTPHLTAGSSSTFRASAAILPCKSSFVLLSDFHFRMDSRMSELERTSAVVSNVLIFRGRNGGPGRGGDHPRSHG